MKPEYTMKQERVVADLGCKYELEFATDMGSHPPEHCILTRRLITHLEAALGALGWALPLLVTTLPRQHNEAVREDYAKKFMDACAVLEPQDTTSCCSETPGANVGCCAERLAQG